MIEPDAATNITAEHGATVGIQAEQVHNSTVLHNSAVYQVLPDASPAQKYKVGVRFLEDGVPIRARELIYDAMAQRYEAGEVRFHWVLAMLSKRSYRDLTPEEREQLGRTSAELHKYADDEWKRALEAICELLVHLKDSGSDPGPVLRKLLALPPRQRDLIVRHLDLVLTGGMKDSLWAETRQAAENGQFSEDRLNRVWAYFHPDPVGPRVRKPAEPSTTPGDWLRTVIWSGLFIIAVGYLGWLVLVHATPLPILAYLLALAAGYVGASNGLEWCYRADRLRVKDLDYFGQRGVNRAPEGGFASQVDHSFSYYFNKYVPRGASREVWLADTVGIRNTLRDEIVELYREERVKVGKVNWLIRYLVTDVGKRRAEGTLWEYRERYRIAPATKVWCSLSIVALVPTVAAVIVAALQTDPIPAAISTLVALTSGRFAAARWLYTISERRRYAEDRQECERLLVARHEAFQRWKGKLNSKRPSEKEMETWLTYDKNIILDKALRHYRLAWRDIIAHAFLQTPAKQCKRARVNDGHWRYSKYDILLFLITQDGVREVSAELNFERGALDGEERNNFRFDAVSSVHVAKAGDYSYTLELTLMNGPTRNIRVADPGLDQLVPGENPEKLSEINLDASGFTHTLHILEGIAAEGKGWIDRDPYAKGTSVGAPSTATVRTVTSLEDRSSRPHRQLAATPAE